MTWYIMKEAQHSLPASKIITDWKQMHTTFTESLQVPSSRAFVQQEQDKQLVIWDWIQWTAKMTSLAPCWQLGTKIDHPSSEARQSWIAHSPQNWSHLKNHNLVIILLRKDIMSGIDHMRAQCPYKQVWINIGSTLKLNHNWTILLNKRKGGNMW